MRLNIKKVRDFINPLLSKKSIDSNKFGVFRNHLEALKQLNQGESEEHQKNSVRDFLANSFGYTVNTKGRIDLAIFKNHALEVIIEAKSLTNKAEMITQNELNRKAFSEAIKYFMDERKSGNNNVRHIIILTAFEWFVFDAKDFERLFWQDKDFKKIYNDYTNPNSLLSKTGDVYNEFSALIPKKKSTTNLFEDLEIDCVYFNLKEPQSEKDLVAIYKLLSPDSLLKEFNPNDTNILNREFYTELLYILGLEEVKDGGKKLIGRAKSPQSGSFYENIAQKLETYSKPSEFEDIIKLIIIWINRILFLKLLESQIITWNSDPKLKFLNIQKIGDYDKLEMLFFEILAKRPTQRIHKEFDYIPYLNSSLFEVHADEQSYLKISNLSDDAVIEFSPKTVIRDEHRSKKSGKISTLAYLFEFLDAYDFGSISDDEISTVHNKTLISASVLGLIFEKINGYKDGSFYTPSFITMYMCRESLHASVVERFNRAFEIDAQNFEELRRYCDKHSYKEEFQTQANVLINTITICDPAVGSGHFLVSALNEVIFIKYQLGLFHLRGLRLDLANDELLIMLEDEWFEYTCPKDFQSANHVLQKMLFTEKQQIIENQLFGVDINPNSTQITKLRLWIELLKNSYYDENYQLVTLPNIDINIKCGNSLISRFDLTDQLKIKNIAVEIEKYKGRVSDYKNNLGTKKEILESIQNIKDSFRLTLKAESKVIAERNKILREYVSRYRYTKLSKDLTFTAIENNYGFMGTLFDDDAPDTKDRKKLFDDLMKHQNKVDEIESGKNYENAFEWRFEFPEVLDENGNFVGFDVVIGNPPYIMEDDNKSAFDGLRDKPCYQGKTDIWHLFSCLGLNIIKPSGLMSYIAKNQWFESTSASKMRKSLYENGNILSIIDFGTNMVFEEASQQTMIFLIQKNATNVSHDISYKKVMNNLSNEKIAMLLNEQHHEDLKVTIKKITKDYDENANLTFSSSQNEIILEKIEGLKNFEFDEKKEMIQGLIGGPDEAFIVSKDELSSYTDAERMYIKMLHTNTGKYLTPESNQYIFYISAKNFKDRNIDDLPNIKAHLLPYKSYTDAKGKDCGLDYRRETLSGQKQWYHLWWERDETFFKAGDKLVWAKRTQGAKFTYTDGAFYGTANLFFIKTDRVELKYVTALLNSKLMYFYMHERLKHTGDLLQIDKNQFMKIPIYVPSELTNFVELTDKIIDLKKADSKADATALENQIDEMVYKLYNLTDEEIAIVEGRA